MMTKEFIKLNNLIGWLVWAIATFTYCSTIEPTASFWDCGEYIACSYKLEVGHPPGAPFFLLVGRFFSLFGGGDPALAAMMVNVMSALSSSFSILFLFWTITRLGIKVYGKKVSDLSQPQQWAILGAGVVGGLAYTFSDSFWFSAVEGEVYAMSALFTAIVFWAILKWDEEDSIDPTGALRWLILISYLIGLSIGVHLLNLLVIPSIGFIIYFKKYKFSWKGFFIAGIASVLLLGFVQNLVIPKLVKFISDYEVFFTNKMHLGYSTGTLMFFVLLITSLTAFIMYTVSKKENHYKIGFYALIALSVFAIITAPSKSGMFTRFLALGGIIYAINRFKSKTVTLNAVFLSFATLLIGYSSFFVLNQIANMRAMRNSSLFGMFLRVTASRMKETPCFSASWALEPSGSITVIRFGSHVMWRRISGRVPRPIEPKPIMTMGPFHTACTGHLLISSKLQ
jgi:hypothetical protein